MKRKLSILITILFLFGITSCDDAFSKRTKTTHFEYEGHKYIYFRVIPGYGSGVVHDPDCWCMIDYD